MEHKLNAFKADFYNVFVKGDADELQMARVFIILAIPLMVCLIVLQFIIIAGIWKNKRLQCNALNSKLKFRHKSKAATAFLRQLLAPN